MKIENISGRTYGKLTVIEYSHKTKSGSYWNCICECGNEKVYRKDKFKNNEMLNCGCLDVKTYNVTHGLRNTRIYSVWASMKDRCNNINSKAYKYYGSRGIKVCNEWYDFINFYNWAILNGYDEGLSIDRIDVNGNYETYNCRWVDSITQGKNKRNSLYLTYNGETLIMSDWARVYNIKPSNFYGLLKSRNFNLELLIKDLNIK